MRHTRGCLWSTDRCAGVRVLSEEPKSVTFTVGRGGRENMVALRAGCARCPGLSLALVLCGRSPCPVSAKRRNCISTLSRMLVHPEIKSRCWFWPRLGNSSQSGCLRYVSRFCARRSPRGSLFSSPRIRLHRHLISSCAACNSTTGAHGSGTICALRSNTTMYVMANSRILFCHTCRGAERLDLSW